MVKKFFLLLLFTLVINSIALADLPNFSSMSFDELQKIKIALDNEYNSRPESEGIALPIGSYVVGEDIAPGHYYTALIDPSNDVYTYVLIYNNIETYREDNMYNPKLNDASIRFDLAEDPKILILETGNVLVIDRAALFLKASPFVTSDYYVYEPPEGTTLIPSGTYKIGVDIPAGKYIIYPAKAGETVYRILVTKTDENGNEKEVPKEGTRESNYIRTRNPLDDKIIILDEGDTFYAGRSVALKKWSGFVFDE